MANTYNPIIVNIKEDIAKNVIVKNNCAYICYMGNISNKENHFYSEEYQNWLAGIREKYLQSGVN